MVPLQLLAHPNVMQYHYYNISSSIDIYHMCLQMTYISHNMVSYRDSVSTSLDTLIIQTTLVPFHLSVQKITRLICYRVPLHLYDTIMVQSTLQSQP